MSDSTVARRRRELGLKASHLMTKEVSDTLKRQLVLDQMAKDPAGKLGPRKIKVRIFQDSGIDLTREWIAQEMRLLAPEAYAARGPAHNKGRAPISGQSLLSAEGPQVQILLNSASIPLNTLESVHSTAPPPPSPCTNPPTLICTGTHPVLPGHALPTSMDLGLDSDMASDCLDAHSYNNDNDNSPNRVVTLRSPHPHSHPAQPGSSELAISDLSPSDETFGLAFDVLERATPTLTALKDSLAGARPRNSREYEIVAMFREQLRMLDGQLGEMMTGVR